MKGSFDAFRTNDRALVFIPSMIFAYVILTTFYGAEGAYIAISWLPLLFILTIWLFIQMMSFQHLSDQWWLDLARYDPLGNLVPGYVRRRIGRACYKAAKIRC